VKGIGEVLSPFGRRAWLALINEDSECCRAQRRLLTTRRAIDILLAIRAMRGRMPHCELKWEMSDKSSRGEKGIQAESLRA